MTGATGQARVLAAMEATWPPARRWREGAWLFRDGAGGGKRVSAATPSGERITTDDVAAALDAFARRQEAPLFQSAGSDDALDALLAEFGLRIVDPVILLAAPLGRAAGDRRVDFLPHPTEDQRRIWAAGGIGEARLAVMGRATAPKVYLRARPGNDDRGVTVGAAFAAIHDGIAMIHAIEVSPAHRRSGIGHSVMRGAAAWAAGAGAHTLALAVTRANAPALALYDRFGMTEVGAYHYRMRTEP